MERAGCKNRRSPVGCSSLDIAQNRRNAFGEHTAGKAAVRVDLISVQQRGFVTELLQAVSFGPADFECLGGIGRKRNYFEANGQEAADEMEPAHSSALSHG